MNRAFVKGDDSDSPEQGLPERMLSEAPNYVRRTGLDQLRRRYEALQERHAVLKADGEAFDKPKLQEIEQSRLKDLKDLAKLIAKQSITIEANANEEGQLYGSVGAAEIVSALKQNEITLTIDQIRLEGVLKELGLYTVKVHLHQEIESELKVWVVPTIDGN